MKIERAVVSVSNKAGLGELGSFLKGYNVEIMSTGGTKKYLDEQGVPRSISVPIQVSRRSWTAG